MTKGFNLDFRMVFFYESIYIFTVMKKHISHLLSQEIPKKSTKKREEKRYLKIIIVFGAIGRTRFGIPIQLVMKRGCYGTCGILIITVVMSFALGYNGFGAVW